MISTINVIRDECIWYGKTWNHGNYFIQLHTKENVEVIHSHQEHWIWSIHLQPHFNLCDMNVLLDKQHAWVTWMYGIPKLLSSLWSVVFYQCIDYYIYCMWWKLMNSSSEIHWPYFSNNFITVHLLILTTSFGFFFHGHWHMKNRPIT